MSLRRSSKSSYVNRDSRYDKLTEYWETTGDKLEALPELLRLKQFEFYSDRWNQGHQPVPQQLASSEASAVALAFNEVGCHLRDCMRYLTCLHDELH